MASASTTKKWWENAVQVGNVIAYHIDLSPDPATEAEAFARLDEYERSRTRRFTTPGPRRRFILCRAAVRSILCSNLGCHNEQLTIGSSYYEKPYAIVQEKSHPISFNVSHSGAHGLIALSSHGRLGVDIEECYTRRNIDLLVDTSFTPAERADMKSGDVVQRQRLFFRLWTIKEALIKAVGIGLSIDMSSFEVPLEMRRGAIGAVFHFPQAPSVAWRLDTLSSSAFCGAIAQEITAPLSDKQLDKRNKALKVSAI